jgi:fructose-1,6-bisphosphatase/inositol monophosphatase family enzyme
MQALVARGVALAAVDCAPRVWDAAAAHVLVEAAGGQVVPWQGEGFFPLRPGVDYATQRARLLAVTSPAVLAQVQQVLRASEA